MTNKLEIRREQAMNSKRILELVELLGEVAHTAFQLADNSDDRGYEAVVQMTDFTALSDALDACDELPELDDVYVRDGWLRALDELRALLAAPVVERQPMKYDDTLLPFVALMRKELHANAGKGDRPGWLSMPADTCLLEIYYHAAKLQKAIKDGNGDGIAEYSADVANMAMMVADMCGAIHLTAPVVGQEPSAWTNGLAPCPLCGAEAESCGYADSDQTFVQCTDCGCYVDVGQERYEIWNDRSEQPAPVAVVNLRNFANAMIDIALEGGNADGIQIQELAVEHGLLKPEQRTERCGDACSCAEYADFPVECFRKVKELNQ